MWPGPVSLLPCIPGDTHWSLTVCPANAADRACENLPRPRLSCVQPHPPHHGPLQSHSVSLQCPPRPHTTSGLRHLPPSPCLQGPGEQTRRSASMPTGYRVSLPPSAVRSAGQGSVPALRAGPGTQQRLGRCLLWSEWLTGLAAAWAAVSHVCSVHYTIGRDVLRGGGDGFEWHLCSSCRLSARDSGCLLGLAHEDTQSETCSGRTRGGDGTKGGLGLEALSKCAPCSSPCLKKRSVVCRKSSSLFSVAKEGRDGQRRSRPHTPCPARDSRSQPCQHPRRLCRRSTGCSPQARGST